MTVIAAGFDGGEPASRPAQNEKRSSYVEAAVPASVGATSTAAPETSQAEGWAPEPEVPVVASLDDFEDDADLDIPDFLK